MRAKAAWRCASRRSPRHAGALAGRDFSNGRDAVFYGARLCPAAGSVAATAHGGRVGKILHRLVCGGCCDWSPRHSRAYSSSKVIHRWGGGASLTPASPSVNNFGGGETTCCSQLLFCPILGLGTQGPEDEFRALTQQRSPGDFRSGTLRPAAKEHSEPFACKCKLAATNLYKRFHPAGTACPPQLKPTAIL